MYEMRHPEAVNLLEKLARDLQFMTPEMEAYIAEQRQRMVPKTPAELRKQFDNMRRYTPSVNDCARGMDDYYADQREEMRRHLAQECPEVMGDYFMEFGTMKFGGTRSDVWAYHVHPYDDDPHYFEVWREYIEEGVLIRCRRLEIGVNTLRCGTSYEINP